MNKPECMQLLIHGKSIGAFHLSYLMISLLSMNIIKILTITYSFKKLLNSFFYDPDKIIVKLRNVVVIK